MLPLYTLSSKPETIQQQLKLTEPFSFSPIYQARPGMHLPILIAKEKKTEWVKAKWGTKKPLITMDRILATRPYNILVRKQRCAVPANCFFSLKAGQPYLIRLLQHRLFLLGGIFNYAMGGFHFAILETEPADMLNGMEGQSPVVMAPEKLSSWLCGDEPGRVMHYADRAGSYWYDYFPVSEKILQHTENNKELLKPEGISLSQLKEHQKKIRSIHFEKERPNRSNLKHR